MRKEDLLGIKHPGKADNEIPRDVEAVTTPQPMRLGTKIRFL